MPHINSYKDLRVYQAAIDAAIDLALRCGYLSKSEADEIDASYDGILGQLVRMIDRPDQWTISKQKS